MNFSNQYIPHHFNAAKRLRFTYLNAADCGISHAVHRLCTCLLRCSREFATRHVTVGFHAGLPPPNRDHLTPRSYHLVAGSSSPKFQKSGSFDVVLAVDGRLARQSVAVAAKTAFAARYQAFARVSLGWAPCKRPPAIFKNSRGPRRINQRRPRNCANSSTVFGFTGYGHSCASSHTSARAA